MDKYLSVYNEKERRIISDNIKNYSFIEVLSGKVIKSKWNRNGLIPFDIHNEIVAIQPPMDVVIGLPEINSEGLFIKYCTDWNRFKKETKIYKFKSGFSSKNGFGLQVWDKNGSTVFNSSAMQMKVVDNITLQSDEYYGYKYPFDKKAYKCDVAILPVYGPEIYIDGGEDGGGNDIAIGEIPCIGLSNKNTVFLSNFKRTNIGTDNLDFHGLPIGCFANFLVFDVSGLKQEAK